MERGAALPSPDSIEAKRRCHLERVLEDRVRPCLYFPCGRKYLIQDCLHIVCNLIVPKAEHAVPPQYYVSCPFIVLRLPVPMLAAIDFDHEHPVGSTEVDDVAADGVLPAELDTAQATISKLRPEDGFGLGLLKAKLPCLVFDDRG